MLVVDASVTLAWLLPEEATAASKAAFARVVALGAVVPAVWQTEVANALLVAERRGRISAAQLTEALGMVRAWPITVDGPMEPAVLAATVALARTHSLTVYDAAYLYLAASRRLPLATFDAALRRAAGPAGVELVPGSVS